MLKCWKDRKQKTTSQKYADVGSDPLLAERRRSEAWEVYPPDVHLGRKDPSWL